MFTIREARKGEAKALVAARHYSRSLGMATKAFVMLDENLVDDGPEGPIVGVAVYRPGPLPIAKHAFHNPSFPIYELTRVVVQTRRKNAASFLVGNSLKMLPAPCAVVSYADSAWGHAGIIYQATNWVYTGSTVSHDNLYLVDGKRTHPRILADRGITSPAAWAKANGIETIAPEPKHRYFQFVGTKKEKHNMLKALRYPVVREYPKCDYSRYDDGDVVIF